MGVNRVQWYLIFISSVDFTFSLNIFPLHLTPKLSAVILLTNIYYSKTKMKVNAPVVYLFPNRSVITFYL